MTAHHPHPAGAFGDLPGHPLTLLRNPRHGVPGMVVLPEGGFRRVRGEIESWPGYAPTPLLDLPDAAAAAGVAAVRWKDESGRFGLGSFKALGGAQAVFRVLLSALARAGVASSVAPAELEGGRYAEATRGVTVCCATDGNHGRAVAWGARRFGCRCVVFVHPGVSAGRRDAIARWGAEVREVPGRYDDAVRAADAAAAGQGWHLVSDTARPGDTEIPREVMQGYRLMAAEALEASPAPFTHVFAQAGVGGMAAAVSVQARAAARAAGTPPPRLVVVEPEAAACCLASARAGRAVAVDGALDTLMAGLACGEPSLLAWQELERAAWAFLAVPDAAAVDALRALARRDPPVEAGESAVAGLAALLLAGRDPAARAALGLDGGSRVLLLGTEGATDPALRDRLVGFSAPAAAAI